MSLKSFSEVGTCTVMNEIFNFIESTKDRQIELLAETVSFPSVSAWLPTHRSHILKNIAFYETRFRSLGFETEQRDIGNTIVDGKLEQLPSVLLVKHKMEDPNKKTLLVYGHLDVQPAAMSDGWESDPWVLQERNGSLYGRGSTDDKGPVLAWSNAIEAFEQTGHIVPINIRFLLESMEESGSEGLESLLITMEKVKDPFLKNIDFCVISDNYWLGDKKPCLAYGLRGLSEFLVEIQCAKSDMHSGCCGGLVNEAMTDLVWILDKLVDSKGKIMIPKIYEEVMAISPAEEATYEKIEFDIAKRSEEIGNEFIHKENPVRVLQSLWRHPWLSIHGIEGSFADKGFKTVIPAKVIGKFSIRTVPNMSIKNTEKVVLDYLHTLWAERKSTNRAKFICSRSGEWYYVDPTTSLNFKAARRAIEKVYGESPDLIREGGSIPITIIISKCTGKDVCLLPIGCSNDGAHSQNEKIDVCNYITGCKNRRQLDEMNKQTARPRFGQKKNYIDEQSLNLPLSKLEDVFAKQKELHSFKLVSGYGSSLLRTKKPIHWGESISILNFDRFSIGIWFKNLKCCALIRSRGTVLQKAINRFHLTYRSAERVPSETILCLPVEETLFLMERASLFLFSESYLLITVQEFYERIFINQEISLLEYICYSHLRRLGYQIFRVTRKAYSDDESCFTVYRKMKSYITGSDAKRQQIISSDIAKTQTEELKHENEEFIYSSSVGNVNWNIIVDQKKETYSVVRTDTPVYRFLDGCFTEKNIVSIIEPEFCQVAANLVITSLHPAYNAKAHQMDKICNRNEKIIEDT